MEKVLKKSYKILALSLIILFLGTFFFWQGYGFLNKKKINQVNDGFITDLPPENFPSFYYNPENKNNEINIEIECRDTYYVVLVFDSKDDYRESPQKAKINKAFPCVKGEKITYLLKLREINFLEGFYYYIVADQKEGEMWYNPR